MNLTEQKKEQLILSLLLSLILGIAIFFPISAMSAIVWVVTYHFLKWITPKIFKHIKPHTHKTKFVFLFLVTLFIAGTVGFAALEIMEYASLWPYHMTFLTLLLAWESYNMYKREYPTPNDYKIDYFIKDGVKLK